ncbi:gamma-glutamyltransferase [Spongiibacter taiwanensis]
MRLLLFPLMITLSLSAMASDPLIVPEAASGLSETKAVRYQHAMAVTANPYASEAAKTILQQGGSAVDAAITAQLVLGLVEPQSSGIGGGAFMLHWDSKTKQLSSWNGRETAPVNTEERHFLTKSGKPMSFYDAVIGGYAVGVPGVVAMLEAAHKAHGKLPWSALFAPAITLAEQGFMLSPRLHTLLSNSPRIAVNPAIRDCFFVNGKPKPVGTVLKNPAYASTLKQLAEGGAEAFYHGGLAKQLVAAVTNDPNRPGKLQLSDLANYRAQQQPAICAAFLQYQVCGAPPPSSGGTTVLAILGMIENATKGGKDILPLHSFIEASRIAFADRNRYIADPDFVEVPTQGLVDPGYLKQRADLISDKQRLQDVTAGNPPGAPPREGSESPELPSTSHFSIVDSDGNVVSMTTSIETAFGSRVMVGGFLLNNQLTDFSFAPKDETGELIANRIESGKRPRSSMSPTIVLKDGQPILAIGSPGGARIIDYVALSLYRILAMDMPIDEAISAGHVVAMGPYLELEAGRFTPEQIKVLEDLGHAPRQGEQTSGLHVIRLLPDGLEGAADPRREGEVAGF